MAKTDAENNFFKKVIQNVVSTLKTKTIGFYLGLAGAVLCIALSILYKSFYGQSEYYSATSSLFIVLGAALFLLLSLSNYTSRYAAIPMLIGVFVGLLLFVNAVYIYFADIFYGGVNKEAFEAMDPKMIISLVMFFVTIVISNVAMWLRQNKDEVSAAKQSEELINEESI